MRTWCKYGQRNNKKQQERQGRWAQILSSWGMMWDSRTDAGISLESSKKLEVSFVISLPNGRKTIRHWSHLRHNINRYTRITETKVRFDLKGDKKGEDRKKSETKRSVQPLKLHKSKSADSWEIVSNQNKDSEIGIATRTRSKVTTDKSEIPLKSALKKRTLEN